MTQLSRRVLDSKRDKKGGSRVPISSKLVADLMKRAGANNLMMLDPHTPQLEGFFDMPVDALKVNPLFCEWIRHHVPDWGDCVVLSPDEGGTQKSASVAADLGLDFALIHTRDHNKHRYHAGRNKKPSIMEEAAATAAAVAAKHGVNDGEEGRGKFPRQF